MVNDGTEPLGTHDQPLALGRVTILGLCAKVSVDERAAARATFLKPQPSASYYVDFEDFAFYRLQPVALRCIGGFGRMSWVNAEEYRVAEPDCWRLGARPATSVMQFPIVKIPKNVAPRPGWNFVLRAPVRRVRSGGGTDDMTEACTISDQSPCSCHGCPPPRAC